MIPPPRRRVRRLLALGVVSALLATLAGMHPASAQVAPAKGRWRPLPTERERQPTPEQRRLMRQLESVGYVAGSRPAPSLSGVTVLDSAAVAPGLNLLVSGHAPEAILMDMEGRELQSWSFDCFAAFPTYRSRGGPENHTYWRRAHMFRDGSLLAVYEGIGLIKLNRFSELQWAYPGKAHHDLEVTPDGRILVLVREAHMHERYGGRRPILEDYLVVLDADGRELQRVSILEALENSDHAGVLAKLPPHGDLLHTNTVELLDGRLADRLPAFAAGNVLISILKLDLIAVLDPDAGRVVWALEGPFTAQHQPTVLDSGRLLVFDNRFEPQTASRVIEIDPVSAEILWDYTGSPERPFYTFDCGTSERLPNGNTLIVESNAGRAFEVTPAGDIVWEYYNPHRAGPRNDLIASIFDVVRYPPGYAEWRE